MPNRKNVVLRGVNRSSRASPSGSSPRSVSPAKKQAQTAAIALAKKKQKEAEKEKKDQQAAKDQRYHELWKKRESNSPTISPRNCGGRGEKKKKKKNTTKKNLLDDFKNSVPGQGDVADDDRAPNDSSSGSGGEEDKPGDEDPGVDEGLYAPTILGANDPGEEDVEGNAETEEQENGADGDDKESSLVKGGLKNDEDYNSDTDVKNGDDDNATESKEEAEIKGDQGEVGVDEPEAVTPISPANLKQPPATDGQEIVDIVESPQLGPVLEISVIGRIGKDGKKVVCIATLPGREYFSDDIEDAIFDDAKCEPPYVDWTVGATEQLSASPACAKRYKTYFSAKNQESVKGNTITAKVGKNALRARDLDTLRPEAWLNDQVIDVMT
jgi:hypothetical protein